MQSINVIIFYYNDGRIRGETGRIELFMELKMFQDKISKLGLENQTLQTSIRDKENEVKKFREENNNNKVLIVLDHIINIITLDYVKKSRVTG